MVNAQEYVDQTYPLHERSGIENLDLSDKNLEGEVDLSDFTNLKEVNISYNPELEGIRGIENSYRGGKIFGSDNQKKNTEIKNYIKAQEWLEKKYFDKDNAEEIEWENEDGKCELIINGFSHPRFEELEGELIISNFPNLKKIVIGGYGTKLDKLEILNCPQLAEVNCYNNQLTNLIFDNCPNVTKIYCYNNQLTNLDLRKLTNLNKLNCSANSLVNLDLSNCRQLTTLFCERSGLVELDLSNNSKLVDLICGNNGFFGGSGGENNRLTDLNLKNNKELKTVNCSKNQLVNLNLSQCKDLTTLYCFDNLLSELDLSNCSKLQKLKCSNNQLTSLDLNKQSKLTTIDCSKNLLEDIDLPTAGQENLTHLHLENNNFWRKIEPCYPFYFHDHDPYSNYQVLSFLAPFVNLKQLWLGNTDEERIQKGVYNRFVGSLEPLKNMNKLESLHVDNTDIDHGWEHLPLEKLNEFHFSFDKRFYSRVDQLFYSLCDPDFPGHPGEEFVKKNWIKLGKFKDCTAARLLSRAEDLQSQLWEEKKKVYELTEQHREINKKNAVLNIELKDCQKQLIETKEKNSELENELTIERDHAADIDKWYKGQLDSRSDKERNKLWNEILELKWEEERNKQIIKKLEDNLVATNKLAEKIMEELESEKLVAQIQVKKVELTQLKSQLHEEEKEWLDIYCEAKQETEKSSFVKNQITRAKSKLAKKLTSDELDKIVVKQKEIKYLEQKLSQLQIKNYQDQIEIPSKK